MPHRRKSGVLNSVYLITFACYGAHLPGDNAVVDRHHHVPGGPYAEIDDVRLVRSRLLLKHTPYLLNGQRRGMVLQSLIETCRFRSWHLMAAHVRLNHVHAVVDSPAKAEEVMNALKAYASRALNHAGVDPSDQKRWARHGSTRYLWNHDQISAAITYVLDKQGDRMATYDCEIDGR